MRSLGDPIHYMHTIEPGTNHWMAYVLVTNSSVLKLLHHCSAHHEVDLMFRMTGDWFIDLSSI